MHTYGKAIVAVLTAGIVAAYQYLSGDDQAIDATEWVSVTIALVTAVGVYLVPLAPGVKWGKTAIAVVLAVLQILVTAILDGITTDEILLMLITAAGAAGVWIAPAISTSPSGTPLVSVGTGSDR
jgi:hypothetical protein